MRKPVSSLFIILIALASCRPDDGGLFDRPFAGNADFSKFVVAGDGYTAGYMDAALYQSGQQNSIGLLLAQQIGATFDNPPPFLQPEVFTEIGFGGYDSLDNPQGKWLLENVEGFEIPFPVRTPGTELSFFAEDPIVLNSFSVPGAKVFDALVPGYGLQNPFYGRFASSVTESTILGDVAQTEPTFFVFWMGFRDILNYATNGATGRDGGTGANDMTSVDNFRVAYQAAVNSLLIAEEVNGMLINMPDILHLPFFTGLPHEAIFTSTQDSIELYNQYFRYNIAAAGWNTSLRDRGIRGEEFDRLERPIIVFRDNGFSAPVFEDPSLEDVTILMPDGTFFEIPKIRQLARDEMLLLSFPHERIEEGIGTRIPLPKEYTLTKREIEQIRNRITDFNRIIEDQVMQNATRLGLVNMRFAVQQLSRGIPLEINGVPVDASIQPGIGLYSADGVHFNPRGNAHFTNIIIEAINRRFQSNLFFIDVSEFRTNEPAL